MRPNLPALVAGDFSIPPFGVRYRASMAAVAVNPTAISTIMPGSRAGWRAVDDGVGLGDRSALLLEPAPAAACTFTRRTAVLTRRRAPLEVTAREGAVGALSCPTPARAERWPPHSPSSIRRKRVARSLRQGKRIR
jgi:hypothetical protein